MYKFRYISLIMTLCRIEIFAPFLKQRASTRNFQAIPSNRQSNQRGENKLYCGYYYSHQHWK